MIAQQTDHKKNLPTRKHRILVADDDPAILDALKMMLEISDYEVETIANGAVIPTLKQNRPQLILLDIWMSGTDGREICKEMKARKETCNIPVIMISASRDVEKSTKEAGANDFLAKPFEMTDLLNKIEKHISN